MCFDDTDNVKQAGFGHELSIVSILRPPVSLTTDGSSRVDDTQSALEVGEYSREKCIKVYQKLTVLVGTQWNRP